MGFEFRCPIYPIVGDTTTDRSPLDLADQLLGVGLPLLQLRLKQTPSGQFVEIAAELQRRCARQGAHLIVNDRCDIAAIVGAAGVHLGQDDLAPEVARQILGSAAVIGLSTHDEIQLDRAVGDGAVDYVAFGPIFDTNSKRNPDPIRGLDGLRRAALRCSRPLVAIGGITVDNVADVMRAGADAAAVIGAIAAAADPTTAARDLIEHAKV